MEEKLNTLFQIIGEVQNLIYKHDSEFQNYFFQDHITESSFICDVHLGDYLLYVKLADKSGLLRKAEIDYLDLLEWYDSLSNK